MTKAQLDQFIGRDITVTFWGGEEISGVLEYPEKMEPPDYKKPEIYWIGKYGFKVSHVRSLRER